MHKGIVLSVFALMLFLTAGFVSASYDNYNYGGYYNDYNYGGSYGNYDCGYGYSFWDSDCYRTDTYRDTTENKHTTTSTSRDRYTTESTKTITTTYTDTKRETKTPVFGGSYYSDGYYGNSNGYYRTFYPSRTVIGHVDGYPYPYSYWRYKEPYDNSNPYHVDSRYNYYYEPRYDYDMGYYNWRY